MERLTSRDAEYGTIDGLIASNVGESTLAVSVGLYVFGYMKWELKKKNNICVMLCIAHMLSSFWNKPLPLLSTSSRPEGRLCYLFSPRLTIGGRLQSGLHLEAR